MFADVDFTKAGYRPPLKEPLTLATLSPRTISELKARGIEIDGKLKAATQRELLHGMRLKKIKGVIKVEIFAKAHDSIYKILILLKNIITVFTFLIVILGVLLMIRQIKIWLLEHTRRIEVMELLGAPFFLKSARLYQLSFLDAILATILCICFYIFMPHFAFYINTMATIGIEISSIILDEILILLGISLLTAFICVSITMISISNKGTK